MSQVPVIFLAFANRQDAFLASLGQEADELRQLLTGGEDQQRYKLHIEQFATVDSLRRYLIAYQGRVELFHYGGHAGSEALWLADQDGDSGGIAALLAEQPNLKAVILNGCSTRGQVARLLDLGVPAVIATDAPVNDRRALDFAKLLYQALAGGASLDAAFRQAAAALRIEQPQLDISVHRGLSWREAPADAQLPWGLYVREGSEAALEWKLPEKRHSEIIIRGEAGGSGVQKPVNEALTQTLFDVLSPFSEELEFFHFQAERGREVDIRKVRLGIMNSLPAPVGEQVRKLFAADPETQRAGLDRISVGRLEQLVVTYHTLTELAAFVMLAQLWDVMYAKPRPLTPEAEAVLRQYFRLREPEALSYDYIPMIGALSRFFEEAGVTCFIAELIDLRAHYQESEDFRTACAFMQELSEKLLKDGRRVGTDEIEALCVQAEEKLCMAFRQLGFLARYKLATIKNIDIVKERHQAPQFQHYKVKLDTVTAGYLDVVEPHATFTDSKTVVLLRSHQDVREYLGLSPLVVDENALTGEKKSKLFFFTHADPARGVWNYKFVNIQSDRLQISSGKYPGIALQWEAFFQAVFGKSIENF